MTGALMDSDNEIINKLRIEVAMIKVVIGEHEKALKLARDTTIVWITMAVSVTAIITKFLK